MRILVGWDDEEQIELLKMYLDVDGNAVITTTDPKQFEMLVDSPQTFDVILMTTAYPDSDSAFATFQKLLTARPGCPVVAACNQTEVYRIARFMGAGLRNYLIRDTNGDFLFLVQAILQAAVHQVEMDR